MDPHTLRIVSRGKTPATGRLEHLPKLWLHAPVRFELSCAAPDDTEAALTATPTYAISIHSLDASRNPVDEPLLWYAEVSSQTANDGKSKGPHAIFDLSAADIANITAAGEYWIAFHASSGGERIPRAAGYITFADDGFPTEPPDPTPPGTVYLTQAAGDSRYVRDPGTVVDNRLVRWDGTSGNQVQSSAITVDDAGNLTTTGTLTVGSVSASGGISTSVLTVAGTYQGEFYVDALTADRVYDCPDASGTLALTGEADGKVKLIDLKDVTITTPSTGQVLTWNGTVWVNANPSGGGGGGGSVTVTGNDGIGVAGSPGTSITLSLGNITPDSLDVAGSTALRGSVNFQSVPNPSYGIELSAANLLEGGNIVYFPQSTGTMALVGNDAGNVTAADIADGTAVGRNILKLTNPGAITFLRMNADNTVTALSDSNMRTALGLGNVATRNVGTTAGTAAAGDDSRFHSAVTLAGSMGPVFSLSGQEIGPSVTLSADGLVFWDENAGQFDVITLPGTTNTFLRVDGTFTASGDVYGPASSTSNAVARFNGTGGKTLLDSAIVIDDATASTQQNVAIRNVDPATNSALVLTPKGTGAFILGPKPDGTTAGGVARGARAVDLSMQRSNPAFVASGTDSFVCGVTNRATAQAAGCLSGDSNAATSSRAVCAGGFSNTASGSDSVVAGGQFNIASQDNSAILGGNNNTASGPRAVCIGGNNNSASGGQAIAMGTYNTASAISTLATGQSAVANRFGMRTHAAGSFSSLGDAQTGTLVARNQTTSATQTELFLNQTSDRVTLLNNQSFMVDVFVLARSAAGADDACFHRRCLITRDANAASTTIVGLVQTIGTDIETAGATAWDATLAADTTNGALRVLVTGAASTNINWVAKISTVEVIRA